MDRERCHYCGCELDDSNRTIDHIIPRAMGGLDERFNWTYACRTCNGDKASKYPTCPCGRCAKTRRIHRERFRITGTVNGGHKRRKEVKDNEQRV